MRVGSTKASNIEENYVLDEFFTSIQLNVIRDENAYLLTQLLADWLQLCNERHISSLITRTNQIRRKIEERFGDDVGFFPSGKYIIVPSAFLTPCTYSVATLKGAGLRDIDIARGFAAMVRRNITAKSESKPESKSGSKSESKSEEESTGFPFTADQLRKELHRGPVNDLYNVIYLTVKSTCKINKHG